MPLHKKRDKRINRPKRTRHSPKNILPHVVFLRAKPFENFDVRRFVSGVAGNFGFPLQIRQIKIIEFSDDAVRDHLVIGNHRHFGESGQWELIVVLGKSQKPIFRFRYRNYNDNIQEKLLKGGNVVLVPPGCSLALVALKPGVKIIEISNKEYDHLNYADDKLF